MSAEAFLTQGHIETTVPIGTLPGVVKIMKHSLVAAALAALGVLGCSSSHGAAPEKVHASKKTAEPPDDGWGADAGHKKGIALDECGLDTGYAGDENCILPPPPDKGFQLHVGPDDYDDPDAASSGSATS
jgi:hypothetical protein